jgi:hypothetical protein
MVGNQWKMSFGNFKTIDRKREITEIFDKNDESIIKGV